MIKLQSLQKFSPFPPLDVSTLLPHREQEEDVGLVCCSKMAQKSVSTAALFIVATIADADDDVARTLLEE